MAEAKEGKIDADYFKSMIQKKEVIEKEYGPSGMTEYDVKYDFISGWFLNFFAYLNTEDYNGKIPRFQEDSMKVKEFKKLANQMLIVPFTIEDRVHNKTYLMKYKVGFVGCDQNDKKEVINKLTKELAKYDIKRYKMKKDYKHLFYVDGKYLTENYFLKKMFDIKSNL